MAQLLISKPGTMPTYRPLGGERLVIGRDGDCHVRLDDPAVSKQHLAIFSLGNDDILEDLGSTNGTMVNGEVVNRHILQDHDVVQLGAYRLEYLNQRAQKDMDVDRTMIAGQDMLSAALVGSYASRNDAPRVNTTRETGLTCQPAALLGVAGSQAGWHIDLDKIVVPLARAEGVTPAAVLRRPQGYMVMRVSRQAVVRVNGENIGEAWKLLESDDVIEVGKDRYSFYLK
ncbi:MAG: FHA domain-containing protein [Pseudomonadota bacterium]